MSRARQPWRTGAAWIVAVVVAGAAIATLLGGALTTEGNPTNNPQSQRAKHVLARAFPPSAGAAITDIVVVRSSRYTVDAPRFRAVVRGLVSVVRRADGVDEVRSYLDSRDPGLVTRY